MMTKERREELRRWAEEVTEEGHGEPWETLARDVSLLLTGVRNLEMAHAAHVRGTTCPLCLTEALWGEGTVFEA